MSSLTEVQAPGVARFPVRQPMPPEQFEALSREILVLKQQLKAVILAHNYQVPEIQDVADFVGDSLGLSQQAARTEAEVIVFSGVHFMAETAKILNPNRLVVLPDKEAGCSLEESCPADKLAEFQQTNPHFYTIAYINCSAEVKALSDVICTSGNAVRIVEAAPRDRDLLFVPDENLGAWVMEQTGRPMTLWRGNCYAHVEFRREGLLRLRRSFPEAKVVAHPETLREVRELADEVCSTEKMLAYCKSSQARQFIVVTESGILHRLNKECPGKQFICAPTFDALRAPADACRCSECKFMKLNTLEKLRDCMQRLAPRIELSTDIIRRARRPIERMLEISASKTQPA
jgi:quinolinate synthase